MEDTMETETQTQDKMVEAPLGFEGVVTFADDALNEQARKHKIVLEGVCSRCAHCSLGLTDAVSVQRGIGPVCSKKGYAEQPEIESDPVEALIMLSKWPFLVDFLTRYSGGLEKGNVQKLMNGLVRLCSLNRKTEVHDACTDALERLGYLKLASLLRQCLCVVEIRDSQNNPNHQVCWVKKSDWSPSWSWKIRKAVPDAFFSRQEKGMLYPIEFKKAVWHLIKEEYAGLCVRCPDGKAVRIPSLQQADNVAA